MLEQSPASVPDLAALRSCWHPVGYAHALGEEPLRVRLLGEDLVLWRDSGGVRTRCGTCASTVAPRSRSGASSGTG